MARQNRRRKDHVPLSGAGGFGGVRRESKRSGDWIVQRLAGASARKDYLCPHCNQVIPPGTPHIVAWPDYGSGTDDGVEERRHWHTACWSRSQ